MRAEAALAWLDSLKTDSGGGFPDGRAAVLVCQTCGDLECGALSVRVTRGADTVVWSDFGWQVPRERAFEPLEVPLSLEFEARDYDELLGTLAQRLTASAVTPREAGRFWRHAEPRAIIRL